MKLIPVSTLVCYLHATRGFGPQQNEQLLEAVCSQLCAELGIDRGQSSPRKFVEAHRPTINLRAPRDAAAKRHEGAQQREANRAPAKIDPAFAMSVEFLQSYEWRRLRMLALKQQGARCACCGATPATGSVMNVDHIKPRRLFPELALDISNLQVLCNDCNHGKGFWDMTDWRAGAAMP